MAKSKRIIPDFMIDNPDDSFMFLMPIGLRPDLDEDIGNSYFNVVVKNLTTNEHFTSLISPEVFFTHFKLQKAYKNGKLDKQKNKKSKIDDRTYPIDTRLIPEQYDISLEKLLDDSMIGQLLGWKYTYLENAKKVRCCFIKVGAFNLIIPHYVIAIYYYYRSTVLREATLRCNLEDLYFGYDCNPDDASIIVSNYVSEDDAPFIHRFLCQKDAIEAFQSIGTFLNSYIRTVRDKYPQTEIDHIPIKAKFPQKDKFSITTRVSDFYHEGKYYKYVHEIIDDDSPIGFSKFTTLFQGKKIVTEVDDVDNLPTVPINTPSSTSERLKSDHASKRYKHNTITTNRKKKCSSLTNVDLSTDKLTDEEVLEKLKILEEILTDEHVDQSLTGSSGNVDQKTRKTRVSSKGKEFQKISTTEYTHNFHEFNQYIEYMRTQKTIQNLQVYENKKMKTVIKDETGNPNPKCMMYGRERQYITATFKYQDSFVGLLELENSASTSTWVISSKAPFGIEVFDNFLKLYVEDDKSINDMKKLYENDEIKFKTNNHERTAELEQKNIVKWVIRILGKI